MKHARELSHDQLIYVVDQVQEILYLSTDTEGTTWDPDKEWNSETIEAVAGVLEDVRLHPETRMAQEKPTPDPQLQAVIDHLIELADEQREVQFAVDDLVYDHAGTGKHASAINNGGIENQADALIERIGLQETVQALQAVQDDFTHEKGAEYQDNE